MQKKNDFTTTASFHYPTSIQTQSNSQLTQTEFTLSLAKNNLPNSALEKNNWAFVDVQNLIKGVQEKGQQINWKCFRTYLRNRYDVTNAVAFLGYMRSNWRFYNCLEKANFSLEFRPVRILSDGSIDGGNVDADLASFVMDYKNDYQKAIIVADDSDYFNTIKRLNQQNKLGLIISSHSIRKTSELIKRIVRKEQILSIHNLQGIFYEMQTI